MSTLYHYRCEVINVVDGDTIDLSIDLGFSVWVRVRARLHGINAPEMRGQDKQSAHAAKEFFAELCTATKDMMCVVHKGKADKYGRWLVILWREDQASSTVNQRMIEADHAVPFVVD